MSSMCQKHRHQLKENTGTALLVWIRLTNNARMHAANLEWTQAILAFSNALDAAEILFLNRPTGVELDRYIRTASELAYTIKQFDPSNKLLDLITTVENILDQSDYSSNKQMLLRPVRDIAEAPISQVHKWMKLLFQMDNKNQTNSHNKKAVIH